MTARTDADVIIVGAGIAGLGLACALGRHDLSVILIERRRACGGIHRGDSLLPKSTRVLARWGVLDAIRAAGAEPIDRVEVHDGRRRLGEAPLVAPDEADPYLVLPHARIEEVLLGEALRTGRVTLHRPANATDLIQEQGRVTGVRWETATGSGEARARLVVGTDGHRSIVRERLGIEAMVRSYDHAYLGLEADRPASYRNAMRLHLHREGGVLLMPRPTRVGIGMLVDRGSGPHWLGLGDEALARAVCERAPILEGMTLHRRGAHVYELSRAHVARYVARGAAIIGDAAHITNPTAGQGMTMALGDAARLAEIVGPALAGGALGLDRELAQYEARRWRENDRMIRSSHPLAIGYALRGRFWHAVKTSLVRVLASRAGQAVVRPISKVFLGAPSTRPLRVLAQDERSREGVPCPTRA